jgi:hypothetical protein
VMAWRGCRYGGGGSGGAQRDGQGHGSKDS